MEYKKCINMINRIYHIESSKITRVNYFKYFIENYKVKIDFGITEKDNTTYFNLTFKDVEEQNKFNADFRESIGFPTSFTN